MESFPVTRVASSHDTPMIPLPTIPKYSLFIENSFSFYVEKKGNIQRYLLQDSMDMQ
jgi:hypothetical protein